MVRDGSLQFSGAHLRTGPRMVLHSVFGKMLPKDQVLPVLAAGMVLLVAADATAGAIKQIVTNGNMVDLRVTVDSGIRSCGMRTVTFGTDTMGLVIE